MQRHATYTRMSEDTKQSTCTLYRAHAIMKFIYSSDVYRSEFCVVGVLDCVMEGRRLGSHSGRDW